MLVRVHNDETNALDLEQIASKCVGRNSSPQSSLECLAYYFYAFCTTFFAVYLLLHYIILSTPKPKKLPTAMTVDLHVHCMEHYISSTGESA